MIIWSGHGILILVFAALGAYGLITAASPFEVTDHWIVVVGTWGVALGTFFYAKTLGKTREKVMIDPETGEHVALRSSHSLFFIPALGWTVLSFLAAVAMTVHAAVVPETSIEKFAEEYKAKNGGKIPEIRPPSGSPASPAPAVISIATSPANAALPSALRNWTLSNGRSINAVLARIADDGKSGTFVGSNGKRWLIAREDFSEEDQAFFGELLAGTMQRNP